MVEGCRWCCCNVGNWSIVYFRKLKDHFGGRSSSPLLPSPLQRPNLLKGATLWGWGLRMGGGRLGLVPTGRAARTGAGTTRRACIQDHTTWRNTEGIHFIWLIVPKPNITCECWATSYFDSVTLLGKLPQNTKPSPCIQNRNLIWLMT